MPSTPDPVSSAARLCGKPGCGKPITGYDAWGEWCDDHNGGREHPAATPSREALRRIRELEAINAQITRHRDRLGVALRRLANYEGISTPCDDRNCSECRTAKIAREALNG